MYASGTQVDVNDAYATRLLSRGRFECGRVESNHHSQWRRGYSALSSPMLGVRGKTRAAGRIRTDTAGLTTPDAGRYITAAKRMEGGIGSPQPEAETLPSDGPGASCFTFRQSCQRRYDAATPSPVGPGGLSAQLHVRARALPSPCSVTSSTRPSTGRSSNGAGGIRTHGLELMRLARTAAPLPRVALRESEDLVGRIRTCDLRRPKSVGWASLPYDQLRGEPWVPPRRTPRQESNLRHEG